MTKIEKLEHYAFVRDISTYRVNTESEHKGCCATDGESTAIFINKSIIDNSQDELCTLAEEVGHIETGAMLPIGDYLPPSLKKLTKRKNEMRAAQWAIDKLLPPEKIQSALNDCCLNDYEMAEYCDVTQEFIRKAIEYYSRKGITFSSPED